MPTGPAGVRSAASAKQKQAGTASSATVARAAVSGSSVLARLALNPVRTTGGVGDSGHGDGRSPHTSEALISLTHWAASELSSGSLVHIAVVVS